MRKRELTPEQRERRKLYARKYYQENREKILNQQKEYYRKKGKAWNAERARNYRHSHHEAYCAKRRQYRLDNHARFLELDRRYRERRRERYLAVNGNKCIVNRTADYKSGTTKYGKRIDEYCFRAMEKVQKECADKVVCLLERYPFEGFTVKQLRKQLWRFRIYPSQARYDDCYDAGMLAYLYSVHRCAYMGYSNVEGYITKMIRIFLICALVSFQDSKNLCIENGFREVRLDALPYVQV